MPSEKMTIYIAVNFSAKPTELDPVGIDGMYIESVEQIKWPPPNTEQTWAFPVGEGQYSPERWYAASLHSLDGSLNSGYKHSGIDLNLDVYPRGDIERFKGLSVYAVADGKITFVDQSWSGVPMLVMRCKHNGAPLWVRYGHIVPVVMKDEYVKAGQKLGGFANWTAMGGGDHLHFDMALDPFTENWLDSTIRWVDPVDILKAHLDPAIVDAMVRRGQPWQVSCLTQLSS